MYPDPDRSAALVSTAMAPCLTTLLLGRSDTLQFKATVARLLGSVAMAPGTGLHACLSGGSVDVCTKLVPALVALANRVSVHDAAKVVAAIASKAPGHLVTLMLTTRPNMYSAVDRMLLVQALYTWATRDPTAVIVPPGKNKGFFSSNSAAKMLGKVLDLCFLDGACVHHHPALPGALTLLLNMQPVQCRHWVFACLSPEAVSVALRSRSALEGPTAYAVQVLRVCSAQGQPMPHRFVLVVADRACDPGLTSIFRRHLWQLLQPTPGRRCTVLPFFLLQKVWAWVLADDADQDVVPWALHLLASAWVPFQYRARMCRLTTQNMKHPRFVHSLVTYSRAVGDEQQHLARVAPFLLVLHAENVMPAASELPIEVLVALVLAPWSVGDAYAEADKARLQALVRVASRVKDLRTLVSAVPVEAVCTALASMAHQLLQESKQMLCEVFAGFFLASDHMLVTCMAGRYPWVALALGCTLFAAQHKKYPPALVHQLEMAWMAVDDAVASETEAFEPNADVLASPLIRLGERRVVAMMLKAGLPVLLLHGRDTLVRMLTARLQPAQRPINDDCVVCLEPLQGSRHTVVALPACAHQLHVHCLVQCLEFASRDECCLCKAPILGPLASALEM